MSHGRVAQEDPSQEAKNPPDPYQELFVQNKLKEIPTKNLLFYRNQMNECLKSYDEYNKKYSAVYYSIIALGLAVELTLLEVHKSGLAFDFLKNQLLYISGIYNLTGDTPHSIFENISTGPDNDLPSVLLWLLRLWPLLVAANINDHRIQRSIFLENREGKEKAHEISHVNDGLILKSLLTGYTIACLLPALFLPYILGVGILVALNARGYTPANDLRHELENHIERVRPWVYSERFSPLRPLQIFVGNIAMSNPDTLEYRIKQKIKRVEIEFRNRKDYLRFMFSMEMFRGRKNRQQGKKEENVLQQIETFGEAPVGVDLRDDKGKPIQRSFYDPRAINTIFGFLPDSHLEKQAQAEQEPDSLRPHSPVVD